MLIPERVEVVRRIFRETIDGIGRREIVRRLNRDGILPFKASEGRQTGDVGWQTSSVAKIIQSRAVLGEYQPHHGSHRQRNRVAEGDVIEGYFPAVIDTETYWRAQAAVSRRRQSTGGRRGRVGAHILRGICKCGDCGAPMHIINKGKPPKGAVYFACSSNIRAISCGNSRRWRVDELEEALITSLSALDINLLREFSGDGVDRETVRLEMESQLESLKAARTRLLGLVEAGDDLAQERYKQITKSMKSLEAQIEDETRKTNIDVATLEAPEIIAMIGSLQDDLFSDDDERRFVARSRVTGSLLDLAAVVKCSPTAGATVTLPNLTRYDMRTNVRRAHKSDVDGYSILIEKDPTEQMYELFFGVDEWKWMNSEQ